MAWQTPKTNWGVEPVGPGDFNRIEGNAEYLKVQTDTIKTKIGTKRFVTGTTPNIDPESSHIVIHSLGSANVLVSLQTENIGTLTRSFTPNIRYRILDSNRIAIDNVTGESYRVSYSIYKMDW